MNRVLHIIFLLLTITNVTVAQNPSTVILGFDMYMARVEEHHPIAQQAELQLLKGNANLTQARGGFDPKAFSDISQKYFEDKQYYSLTNSGLKIPTWFGLELQSGYEQNQGVFLNPEHNTSSAGLWYAGISLPIGRGLFVDERRAALQQAKIFVQSSQAEQELLLNELLYNAGNAYWEWFNAYHKLQVFQDARILAEQRFNAVKQGAQLGDRPSIDTLEAGIQVQNRMLSLQQAQLDFKNATAMLSVYLWDEGIIPLEIESGTVPAPMTSLAEIALNQRLYAQIDTLVNSHPVLRQYNYKIEQLKIDKRLRQEQLKPALNLKYNAITQPIDNSTLAAYSTNNYTWGLEFGFPIFLRKERGKLRLADLKIQETQLEMNTKSAAMVYKATASINEWRTTMQQIDLYTQTVQDYNGLLAGERQLFNGGESSLFMVNSREIGYINAQLKLIELLSKNRKAILTTNFSLGLLGK